jgi:hypothetical protein
MLAWQRDGVGHGQESITLIAHDTEGLSEAVGTFYEAVAGLDPLTRWALPAAEPIAAARTSPGLSPVAGVVWSVALPDRIVAMKAGKDGLTVLSHDGSLVTLSSEGKVVSDKPLNAQQRQQAEKDLASAADPAAEQAAKGQARPDRLLKLAAAKESQVAIAYWGGTLRIVDGKAAIKSEQLLPQDVTALSWFDGKVVAGLADGRVLALQPK